MKWKRFSFSISLLQCEEVDMCDKSWRLHFKCNVCQIGVCDNQRSVSKLLVGERCGSTPIILEGETPCEQGNNWFMRIWDWSWYVMCDKWSHVTVEHGTCRNCVISLVSFFVILHHWGEFRLRLKMPPCLWSISEVFRSHYTCEPEITWNMEQPYMGAV